MGTALGLCGKWPLDMIWEHWRCGVGWHSSTGFHRSGHPTRPVLSGVDPGPCDCLSVVELELTLEQPSVPTNLQGLL